MRLVWTGPGLGHVEKIKITQMLGKFVATVSAEATDAVHHLLEDGALTKVVLRLGYRVTRSVQTDMRSNSVILPLVWNSWTWLDIALEQQVLYRHFVQHR